MFYQAVFVALSGVGLVLQAGALSLPFTRSGTKDQASDDVFGFENLNYNVSDIYAVELTLSGQKYLVQLDTGSSDLWLDTTGVDTSGFTDTGLNISLTYGDSSTAEGPVLIGNFTFGTFSANQAFISAPGSNATHSGDTGLLGIGPPALSKINTSLVQTTFDGSTLLQNIFEGYNLSEYFTVSLSRSETTGTSNGGLFTIGEIPSSRSNISDSPQLNVVSPDRWIVLMDNIIVNGQNFSGNSSFLNSGIPGQGPEQTLANIDTGTSLALISRAYADAIYGSVPGALFIDQLGVYEVPCDTKLNVSFVFNGQEFPIHPIDTVQATTINSSIICFSGFTVDISGGASASQDLLLGDSFLRNVYALFDFGTFLSGTAPPSITLQSVTDADQAYAEFDTLSAQRNQSLTSGTTTGSTTGSTTATASSSASDAAHKGNGGSSSAPAHLGGWFALLALGVMTGMLIA